MTKAAIHEAKAVMQAHLDALNERDADAITAALRIPHFRLSGDAVKVWETPDRYLTDSPRAGGGATGVIPSGVGWRRCKPLIQNRILMSRWIGSTRPVPR